MISLRHFEWACVCVSLSFRDVVVNFCKHVLNSQLQNSNFSSFLASFPSSLNIVLSPGERIYSVLFPRVRGAIVVGSNVLW